IPERVGEDETAFRISVENLDRLARHRRDDISRTLGVAVDHVFDHAEDTDDIRLRLARGERMHQAGHSGSAAHVALHVFHATSWLDGDAARIEHHALANKGDWLVFRLAAVPLHDSHAWRTDRTLGNAEKCPHPEAAHFLLGQNLDL